MDQEQSDQRCALILKVMQHRPWVCIHDIMRDTNLPHKIVLRNLTRLKDLGKVNKVLLPGQEDVIVWASNAYTPLDPNKLNPSDVTRASPVVGLTESEARTRVLMLKRMKEKLIYEWHPIIDVFLRDYERDLGRVESDRDFFVDDEDES
jgi:hypothetical protein